MTDHAPPGADLLTGPAAGDVLAAVLGETGETLRDWRRRGVHRRGARTLSVLYDVVLDTADGETTALLVGHVSRGAVPEGAATVVAGPATLHVWRFPHDPYLPGLAPAVHRGRVRELLDRLEGPPGEVTLQTRAYRPTRRAVVEVRTDAGRTLYLKVLGGRHAEHVRRRATALADTHRALAPHVPVPAVVGVAARQGIVALGAVGGRTLRTLLYAGAPPPPPELFVDLTRRFAAVASDALTADPRRYADVTRHVELLSALLPSQAPRLRRLREAVAGIGGPAATVHGDLHDGQVLFLDGALSGVLDVDGAGPGLLAQDAGRLVAYVEAAGLTQPMQAEATAAYAQRLFAAYTTIVPARDLALGAATAWIGLATGPHRAQQEDWPTRTIDRLDRAAGWVERAERP